MRFVVRVEGQPPSGNRQHINVWRRSKLNEVYMGRAKAPEVESYQMMVAAKVREAMQPARDKFNPGPYQPNKGEGLIAIRFWLHLKRDIDSDNILKPLFDGVKWGLGTIEAPPSRSRSLPRIVPKYDDARYMPQFITKLTGVDEPFIVMEIDDLK